MHPYGFTSIPRVTTGSSRSGTQLSKVDSSPLEGIGTVQIHVSQGGRSSTSKNPEVSNSDSPLEIDMLTSQTRSRPLGSAVVELTPRSLRRCPISTATAAPNSSDVGESPIEGRSAGVRNWHTTPAVSHQMAASRRACSNAWTSGMSFTSRLLPGQRLPISREPRGESASTWLSFENGSSAAAPCRAAVPRILELPFAMSTCSACAPPCECGEWIARLRA